MSRTLAYFAFLTIYLLGQTLGGTVLTPVSETFGRRTLYIIASIMFCVFSITTAAVPSVAGVYIGRFIQGVAAAIPATVAFGNFNDMVRKSTRMIEPFEKLADFHTFDCSLVPDRGYGSYMGTRCPVSLAFLLGLSTPPTLPKGVAGDGSSIFQQ